MSVYFPIHPVILEATSRIARQIALEEVSKQIRPEEAHQRMAELIVRLADALEAIAEYRRMFS